MTVYDFQARTIEGQMVSLADYRGKVLLIVNVASKCGFTPQYKGLEELYEKYLERGFSVLGFPCNQFGNQEPGGEGEIKSFCELNFGVKFPLFAKIDVNGPRAHPLYQFLSRARPGVLGIRRIHWNFTKFLVGRTGQPTQRFAPTSKPADLEEAIERALGDAGGA